MKPLVIIHGWSDEAESFTAYADALEKRTDHSVEQIWLGDYVSLDDDVRMKDLKKVHPCKDNPAYRSFLIDCTALYNIINERGEFLRLSLSAMPDLNNEKTWWATAPLKTTTSAAWKLAPEN